MNDEMYRLRQELIEEHEKAKTFSRPECIFNYCPHANKRLCTDQVGGCLHPAADVWKGDSNG